MWALLLHINKTTKIWAEEARTHNTQTLQSNISIFSIKLVTFHYIPMV